MTNKYFTVDVKTTAGELIAENMQEGFETLEEAREYCAEYEPEEGTKLVINTWEGDSCISSEDYE